MRCVIYSGLAAMMVAILCGSPFAGTTDRWRLCSTDASGLKELSCADAVVKGAGTELITITYGYPGGIAIMEGHSTDGRTYSGMWQDCERRGFWQLTFSNTHTASGWTEDASTGRRINRVLRRLPQ